MTVHFHDVSHFQTGYKPTGPTIWKATEGAEYQDPTFTEGRAAVLAGGWPILAYHYLTTDPVPAQALNIYRRVGRETRVMWDFEQGGGDLANLIRVHDTFTAMGGHAVAAYVPHWYWQSIGSPSLSALTERDLFLISSNYAEPYSDDGVGWVPYGGVTPTVWQYTDKPIDTNAYKGTTAQLADLFEGAMLTANDKQYINDTVNNAVNGMPNNGWNWDPGVIDTDGTIHLNGGLPVPSWRPDALTNATARPAWYLQTILDMLHSMQPKGGETND